MMDPQPVCNKWADKLMLRLGEFSDQERAEFQHHLKECSECQEQRQEYQNLYADLQHLQASYHPPNILPYLLQIRENQFLKEERWARRKKLLQQKMHVFIRKLRTLIPGDRVRGVFSHLHPSLPPLTFPPSTPGELQPLTHQQRTSSAVRRPITIGVITYIIVGLLCLSALVPSRSSSPTQAASLSLDQSLKIPRAGATRTHAVSWSPNGKYIAVLWDDSSLQVLDAHTYQEIFSQKVGWGRGLAWSPNSQSLASIGRQDNTIQIWDIATHECKINIFHDCLTYTGHTAQIEAIAWSTDGRYLASASDDQSVQVWDASTLNLQYKYQDTGSKVTAIAWSFDNQRLVSGDENNHIQAWDAFTGAHLVNYVGHTGPITSVSWSSNNKNILSSSYDQTVRIWDASKGDTALVFSPHCPILATDSRQSPNGTYLALTCSTGSVQIWQITPQQETWVHYQLASYPPNGQGPYNTIFSISWSPRGDHLIAGGSGNILDFRLVRK